MKVLIHLMKWFIRFLHGLRCIPHAVIYFTHRDKAIIYSDVKRWIEFYKLKYSGFEGFLYLMRNYKAFRNLFYHRIGYLGMVLNILCPKVASIEIETSEIGEGLVIHNGFASVIGAERIGANCTIYQQVTVGSNQGNPVIGDQVKIYPGAKIVGNIHIGNDVIIGVNSTVVKDIPSNSTVLPSLSRYMVWTGNQ